MILLNLAIIGCFIVSAALIYFAVSFLLELIIPYPLKKEHSLKPLGIRFREIRPGKKKPMPPGRRMDLKEINR